MKEYDLENNGTGRKDCTKKTVTDEGYHVRVHFREQETDVAYEVMTILRDIYLSHCLDGGLKS